MTISRASMTEIPRLAVSHVAAMIWWLTDAQGLTQLLYRDNMGTGMLARWMKLMMVTDNVNVDARPRVVISMTWKLNPSRSQDTSDQVSTCMRTARFANKSSLGGQASVSMSSAPGQLATRWHRGRHDKTHNAVDTLLVDNYWPVGTVPWQTMSTDRRSHWQTTNDETLHPAPE